MSRHRPWRLYLGRPGSPLEYLASYATATAARASALRVLRAADAHEGVTIAPRVRYAELEYAGGRRRIAARYAWDGLPLPPGWATDARHGTGPVPIAVTKAIP